MAVVALAAIGWPASDYGGGDFIQFYAGAQRALHRASPYDAAWWAEYFARHPSVAYIPGVAPPYPLWTFVVLLPFAVMPLATAAAAWLVGQLMAVGVSIAALARALRLARDPMGMRVLIALVAIAEPSWFLVTGGNVTGFVFAAFALAVVAALQRRYLLSGACLALVMIKPQSFLLLVPVMLLGLPDRDRRPFALGGLMVAAPLVVASFALEPSWVPDWLTAVSGLQSSPGSNATGWTLGVRIASWLPPTLVALAVLAFAAWWRVRRPPFVDLIAGATPISVFVSPHGWSHEHLYLLVPATIVAAHLVHDRRPKRGVGLAALLAGLGILPWLLLVTPRHGEELLAAVPLVCFGIVVWVSGGGPSRLFVMSHT